MSNGMKEWYSPKELAGMKLPGLPKLPRDVTRKAMSSGWRERVTLAGTPLARERKASGGGWEYHYTVLPLDTQAALTRRHLAAQKKAAVDRREVVPDHTRVADLWKWFDRQTDKKKVQARERLAHLEAVFALTRGGLTLSNAVLMISHKNGISQRTLWNWYDKVRGVQACDRLPYLCDGRAGNPRAKAECHPMAWEVLKADYLRAECRTFEASYRTAKKIADAEGWDIPSVRAMQRRMKAEIHPLTIMLQREGEEKVRQMYPHQERDRSVFHALEAVNADGHMMDVKVAWPGEKDPVRPVLLAFQDLYSGMIVGWRIDRTENSDAVRLAFSDVLRDYGIPEYVLFDNGRHFASKWMTGGVPNRYRFTVRPEEPVGLITSLASEIHFSTPYSGQSKPVERAFRDICENIAKHPGFAGAYTGNSPTNKPHNYGERVVPLEEFLEVLEQGIHEHNTRPGRRAKNCAGRSFAETFRESYEASLIRKPTPEQLSMCLLAAEGITVRQRGDLHLQGNRFWCEELARHVGEKLVVRFDPQAIQSGVRLYRTDGAFVAFAECVEATGFNDVAAARAHARKRKDFVRKRKEAAEAELKLSIDDVAEYLPDEDAPEQPGTRLVRALFGGEMPVAPPVPRAAGSAALAVDVDEEEEAAEVSDFDRKLMRGLQLIRGGQK